MHVYPDNSGWCFVCNRRADLEGVLDVESLPKEVQVQPEDLSASIERIRSLEWKQIRGLEFKANERGYFITWPGEMYYKFRSFNGTPRFLAPKGHKQPLLTYRTCPAEPFLILVEGELNALSILMTQDETYNYDLSSPGSAGNFISLDKEILALAAHYTQVVIWTDHDAAGIKALWHIYPKLVKLGLHVTHYTSKEDANDILVSQGPGGLRQMVERILGGLHDQQ